MIALQGIQSCYSALNNIAKQFKGESNDDKYQILSSLFTSFLSLHKKSDLFILSDYLISYDKIFRYINLSPDDTVLISPFLPLTIINLLKNYKVKIRYYDIDNTCLRPSLPDITSKIEKYDVKLIITEDINGTSSIDSDWNFIWEDKGILVIQDSSDSIGCIVDNKMVGNIAPITIITFEEISIVNMMGASCLIVNKNMLPNQYNMLQYESVYKHVVKNDLGLLDDLRCIIGIEQFNYLSETLKKYQRIGNLYRTYFQNLDNVKLPSLLKNNIPNYQNFHIFVDDVTDFAKYMKDHEIHIGQFYKPSTTDVEYVNIKQFLNHYVCIPIGWWLKEDDIFRITHVIKNYKIEQTNEMYI